MEEGKSDLVQLQLEVAGIRGREGSYESKRRKLSAVISTSAGLARTSWNLTASTMELDSAASSLLSGFLLSLAGARDQRLQD